MEAFGPLKPYWGLCTMFSFIINSAQIDSWYFSFSFFVSLFLCFEVNFHRLLYLSIRYVGIAEFIISFTVIKYWLLVMYYCSCDKAMSCSNSETDQSLREYQIPDYILDPGSASETSIYTPECPVLVFINSRSGGQLGGDLLTSYRGLLNKHQVLLFYLKLDCENVLSLCKFKRRQPT